LINYASKNVDNLLIGRLMGRQELGLYGKAVQVAGLPTEQINDPVGAVTIPALSRLAQTPERYRQAYLRITEKVIMFAMPAVALMIVSADWLVRIVLGPQWGEAAPILVCLGVAGLFQPVMATGGWLLVTQGRTRDMLRWSLINAPISIISIIVGLKWGALGVAASYSVGRLFIANPLMFWFVGRTGPVHTKDFYLLLTPFTCASGAAVLAGLLFRKFWIISSPLMGFVSSAVVVGVATLLVLCLLPRGRAALMDLKHSLLLLRPIGPAPTTGT
jgi:PST family polysaccharide transporter